MYKQFLIDGFGWGTLLWAFGYTLGVLLFTIVPVGLIGWVIMPFGVGATLWVLFKKIHTNSLQYYFTLGVVWAFIAIVFDYFFLYKAFNPADGYYKLDVYLYYLLTLILPAIYGWYTIKKTIGKEKTS